jgi:hypothetical protein
MRLWLMIVADCSLKQHLQLCAGGRDKPMDVTAIVSSFFPARVNYRAGAGHLATTKQEPSPCCPLLRNV